MVSAIDNNFWSRIARRTSPWVRSVQPQSGLFLLSEGVYAPPTVEARICSTKPVHEPQELDAFVCLRTSSSVNRPCSLMALTIVPLQTPLQPQTSAASGMLAARFCP